MSSSNTSSNIESTAISTDDDIETIPEEVSTSSEQIKKKKNKKVKKKEELDPILSSSGSELSSDIDTEEVELVPDDGISSDNGVNVLLGIVHSTGWAWFITVLVLLSLVLMPINILLFKKGADIVVAVIFMFMGFFFLFELLVMMFFEEKYLKANNIFFWADLLAFISIIPDCIPLFLYVNVYTQNQTNFFDSVVSAIRLLRLFRLWKILRVFDFIHVYGIGNRFYPSVIGKKISTNTVMKLSVIIIVLVGIVSIIEFDYNEIGAPMTLEILEASFETPDFPVVLASFLEHYPTTIRVEIGTTVAYQSEEVDIPDLRVVEMEDYFSVSGNSFISIDSREVLRSLAVIDLFTNFITAIFFFIIVILVDRDVNRKIIVPFGTILQKSMEIAKMLRCKPKNDLEILDPYTYYMNVLARMRAKANDYA